MGCRRKLNLIENLGAADIRVQSESIVIPKNVCLCDDQRDVSRNLLVRSNYHNCS